MPSNKKRNQKITFAVAKNVKQFCILFYYEKSKQTGASSSLNNSSDVDFHDFMNLYKKCTAKPYAL